MNEIINPYIAGAPVVETSMFFGREAVFSWIERSLAGKYVDHILVLHGQRRVGKTSVLKQIPNFLPDKYIQVFFDLQGRTNTSLDRFLWWLAREIARTLKQERGISIPRPDRADFTADPEYLINEFLPGLRPHIGDQVLLLTFDEFDTLDRPDIQESLARPLIETLRRLMEADWLNFIFSIGSSGDKLENMQASYTDFFKSALYRKISFLTKEDCYRLITKPVEGVIQYERKAVDRITEITSGHPYFTQLMCHELFSLCQKTGDRRIQTTEVESVLGDVIERGTVNLKFVWDEASDLEKWILAGLAQMDGGGTTPKLAQLLQAQRVRFSDSDLNSALIHLRDKDVITQDIRFIIQLLRMWLQANRPMDRVREELVEVNPIANRYIEIGDEYRDLDQAEQAIESYRQALSVNPGNLKAQVKIASIYLEQGAYQEAAASFELALKIDDEDVVTRTGTCDANLALGDQAHAGGQIEAAIGFYQKILVINPAHSDARQRLADIYSARAEAFLTAGQDDQALSAFNQAIDFTPEDDQLSARYQAVLGQKKAKAIASLLDKAERALARQRWDEAAGMVAEALKLDPENKDLQAKRAQVKDAPRQYKIQQYKREAEQALARGNFDKAIAAIETLVLLAPEDPNLADWLESTKTDQFKARLKVYRDQAESAIAGGDWSAAIAARETALKLSPDDPDLVQELAGTKAAQLQFALDDLERQAVQAVERGDWETAIQAREAALKRSPGDPILAKAVADTRQAWLQAQLEVLKARADEARAQGSWEAAMEAVRAAIQLAPGDPSWTAQLSEIEAARHQAQLEVLRHEADQARAAGDWEAAIVALGKHLELEPGEARIQAEIEAIREDKRQAQLAAFKTQANKAAAGEKWTAAVQAWEGYLTLAPEDQAEAEAHLQHARKYARITQDYGEAQQAIRRKRYGRAIELLQSIIAQDPTYKSTSRLLVEAVEANKAIPMWRKPWVVWSLGALVVVVLGVIFGPKLWEQVSTALQSSPSVEEMTEAVTEAEENPTPTATPHPAQAFAAPVLAYIANTTPDFIEDFSTPQDYWDDLNLFEDSQVQVPLSEMVSDGVLRLTDDDPNKWFDFRPYLIAGENFVLQFDFMSDGTARDTRVSVLFRRSQTDRFYIFENQMNGYWRILEVGPGSDEYTLQEGNVNLDSNRFFTLKLIVVDDQFAIYLDDEPLAVIEDAKLSGEENALAVSANPFKWLTPSKLQVEIDNIMFWNLDVTNLTEQEVSTAEDPTPAPTEEPSTAQTEGIPSKSEPVLAYIAAQPPTFEDDFSTADMVWGSTSEGLSIFALVDGGELTITDHAEDVDWTSDHAVPGLTFPTNNLFNATNFALQFDFTFDGLNEIGVQFRSTNNQSTYYQVMFSSFGEWQLTQNQDEIYLAGDSNSRLGINNTLLLIVHDQNLAIYLNDRLLYEGDDLTISGTSNRISVSGNHGSNGRFDNVKFWNLDRVEIGGQEDEAIEEDSFSQVALKYIESQTTTFEDDFSTTDRLVWGYTSEITPIDDELVFGGELTVVDHTEQPGGGVPNDHAVPGLTFPTNGLFNAENFALQFDFSFFTGNPVKEIGVQFRYPYNQNTGYEINISRNGAWTLTQNDGTISISNDYSTLNTRYNTLLLIVKDQNLAIFLNNELLHKANDLDYFGSFTEITVLGEDHGSEAKFDNVKYWNLDGVELDYTQEAASTAESFSDAALAYITQQSPTFEDDFSTAINEWEWGNTSEHMRIISDYRQGGLLSIADDFGENAFFNRYDPPGFSFPTNGLLDARDFAFQFDFDFEGLEGIGARFRSTAAQNIYYEIIVSPSGSWQLIQEPGEILISDGSGSFSSNFYTLLVIVQNENLAIYLEDELIYETDDLTLVGVSNRIIAESNSDGAIGKFDNVKFWNLDGVDF